MKTPKLNVRAQLEDRKFDVHVSALFTAIASVFFLVLSSGVQAIALKSVAVVNIIIAPVVMASTAKGCPLGLWIYGVVQFILVLVTVEFVTSQSSSRIPDFYGAVAAVCVISCCADSFWKIGQCVRLIKKN